MEKITSSTVTIMVSDLTNAIGFYTEKLGFELKNRYGDEYAEVQAPGLKIGLHPASQKLIAGNNMSIGFGVDNFESSVNELKESGVKCLIVPDGWSRIAHFRDPDKNELYLIENREN